MPPVPLLHAVQYCVLAGSGSGGGGGGDGFEARGSGGGREDAAAAAQRRLRGVLVLPPPFKTVMPFGDFAAAMPPGPGLQAMSTRIAAWAERVGSAVAGRCVFVLTDQGEEE